MKKIFLSILIILVFGSILFGQGIVRGKISDENGEPIVGANIYLKSQVTVGTISDLKGQFSLKISSPTAQTIVVSFLSYNTMEQVVNPLNNEVIVLDFNLSLSAITMDETVVIGKAVKAKDIYMQKIKVKSAVSIDYVSADMIKRTGDVSVSSAVARVSGVSTNGSFITVRGIGDRYMKTAINGSRIPTLDPFTNNIKLDLFPASLIDNIVITKTASPDLPGDWSGAFLSIETKDYPDKLSVNIESSFGYNDQSTFKEILTSQHSNTDWLGYDNSLRDINHNDFLSIAKPPSTYDEFVALGLEDYFKALGISNVNWDINKNTYYKLGLEQLGLLGKAQFNDPTAFAIADNLYKTEYKRQAVALVNEEGIKSQAKLFPNTWYPIKRKAPLNFSQSFSIGNQISLFGKPLGILAGFRYSGSTQYDPNSLRHTYYSVNIGHDTIDNKTSKETNGISGLINLAYKYNPYHSISLLFMPNIIGTNNVQDGIIHYGNVVADGIFSGARIPSQFYESRKQFVYQLRSEHYIPGYGLRIEMSASYTNGLSNTPDYKVIVPGAAASERSFRYLTENLFDSHLNAELPLGESGTPGAGKLKFGGAYQYTYRIYDQYNYEYIGDPSDAQYFGVVNDSLRRIYQRFDFPSNHTFGHSEITASYLMIDKPLLPFLRFSGGLRIEHANMFSDITLFDAMGLGIDDGRRISYRFNSFNPGVVNKLSYLPSANIIIKLKKGELAPINLRLSFSQTVARPSIREISDGLAFDYGLKSNVRGNPDLKTVQINNYDIRFETYFKSGDNISISAFYKDFKNHIEFISFGQGFNGIGMRWINSPYKCWLKGIEIEGKKTILKQLEFRANITLVDSRANMNTTIKENGEIKEGYDISHNMYGQSPYIINSIISYTYDKIGLVATLSYNLQGPRLVIVGFGDYPSVYEMPRNLWDFKASKTIGKHFSVSLKVMDILNTSIRRTYKFPQGYILDFDKYTWGTNYVVALSYRL